MNMQNRLATALCATVAAMAAIPSTAVADTNTLPGLACDAGGNTFQYAKQSGSVRNAASVGVFYWCHIPRDKTTSAPILRLRIKVFRPDTANNFTCTFFSHRANGDFIQAKSRTTTSAGINTLAVNNLKTAANSVVSLACALPSQGRIHSIFWEE